MSGKNRKPSHNGKARGHYCHVCGEHKADEKFSGKGHAAHICKTCAALPINERNLMITLRKIDNMAFRHLSEQEVKKQITVTNNATVTCV